MHDFLGRFTKETLVIAMGFPSFKVRLTLLAPGMCCSLDHAPVFLAACEALSMLKRAFLGSPPRPHSSSTRGPPPSRRACHCLVWRPAQSVVLAVI